MADYHPLIARAVAGLEKNTGENRRALYERARTALVAQLRGVVPALDESEITRERLALEEAIRKVEAESARHAREQARPVFIKRAEAPRREEQRSAAAPARSPIQPPTPAAAEPASPPPSAPPSPVIRSRPQPGSPPSPRIESRPQAATAAPAPSPPPASPPAPSAPPASAPSTRPIMRGPRTLQDEAMRSFRDVASDPNAAAEARRTERYDYSRPEPGLPPAPSLPPAERHPLEEYGQLEPQVQPENLWALPLDSRPQAPPDYEAEHEPPPYQPEPQEPEEPVLPRRPRQPRSYGKYIRMGLVAVLLLAVGGTIWWQSDNIASMGRSIAALLRPSTPQPQREATPSRPKITDRLGQPSSQPQAGPAVAQRVVLYEEDPEDSQGKRFVGTAIWRTETKPAVSGRPPELAVRADIEVPERKMTITWSLRRNTDQSLPASHTIEIVFNIPPDSPSGGVQNVPGVLMKQAEQTRGVPLAGLAVKVTPGFFLIGLSALEADMQRNIQLLKERSWFDIPIVYNNNRRAILAMEKGTPGEKAFNDAFASWGQ